MDKTDLKHAEKLTAEQLKNVTGGTDMPDITCRGCGTVFKPKPAKAPICPACGKDASRIDLEGPPERI